MQTQTNLYFKQRVGGKEDPALKEGSVALGVLNGAVRRGCGRAQRLGLALLWARVSPPDPSTSWRVWDVGERGDLLGGEGHGVCAHGPRPEFHFLTLPGRFPPRH